MKAFITSNSKETQELGELFAKEMILIKKRSDLKPDKVGPRETLIVALEGDLGSGKTTFTQGLLKGLKVKGPYTSPTFVIMKQYKLKAHNAKRIAQNKKTIRDTRYAMCDVYHIDAYRVAAKDILNLGWKEMIDQKDNIIIIEWADRIKKIIPKRAKWIKFKWLGQDKRKITFMSS